MVITVSNNAMVIMLMSSKADSGLSHLLHLILYGALYCILHYKVHCNLYSVLVNSMLCSSQHSKLCWTLHCTAQHDGKSGQVSVGAHQDSSTGQ